MNAGVFIGDEVTAAAYRLAGIETRVGALDDAAVLLEEARRAGATFILMTAEYAQAIRADELDAALAAFEPPFAIVPDAGGRVASPDLVQRVRTALGIAA